MELGESVYRWWLNSVLSQCLMTAWEQPASYSPKGHTHAHTHSMLTRCHFDILAQRVLLSLRMMCYNVFYIHTPYTIIQYTVIKIGMWYLLGFIRGLKLVAFKSAKCKSLDVFNSFLFKMMAVEHITQVLLLTVDIPRQFSITHTQLPARWCHLARKG